MKLTYFKGCADLLEAKAVHRAKVKELHPDLHKEISDVFIKELNEQWDYIQLNNKVFPIDLPQPSRTETKHNPTQYERNRIIDALYKIANSKGHKTIWIYYQYITECRYHNITVQLSDLEYMRTVLGYTEGWEKYKWRELQAEIG